MPMSHVAAPQGVLRSAGTHVPGDPVQVKHSSHAGTQAHDPQSTARSQLLVTEPHLPAQVVALSSEVQSHDPQSTAWLQLLVTLPHFPAHVVVLASGVQTGDCGFFFFFFFFFFSSVT